MLLTAKRRPRSRDLTPARRFRVRLCLEELEARTVLSTYTPTQITTAYGFSGIALAGGARGDGLGQTIAIVDAYHSPNIKADLAAFSTRYGLPQLDTDPTSPNPKFTQLDLSGGRLSPPGDDWTFETALDVEWAHAVAPKANILLVEAASDGLDATGKPADLLTAVTTAANTPGVSVVSMSWGANEVPAETQWDSIFTTPGVVFVAASGDSGAGTIWPSVSPNVVSVGGTTLRLTTSSTISSETSWGNGQYSWYFGGSGGGFSQYEPLPSYQQNAGITSTYTQFGARLNPDVAYDANPSTGFAVINAGRLYTVGGTSAGAPQWAGLFAIANQARQAAGLSPLNSSDPQEALKTLYQSPGSLHDITSGNSTGYYAVVNSSGAVTGYINVAARPGFDLVTGLGSPKAGAVVAALAPGGTSTASPLASTAASSSTPTGSSSSTGTRRLDITASSSSAAGGLVAVLATPAPSSVVNPQFTLPATSVTLRAPAVVVAPPPSTSAFPLAPVFAGGPDAVAEGAEPVDPNAVPGENRPGPAVPPAGPVAPQVPPAVPMPQREVPGPEQEGPADGVPLPGSVEQAPSGELNESPSPVASSAAGFGLAAALALPWWRAPRRTEDRRRPGLRK
jgi:subtilase family serine protease